MSDVNMQDIVMLMGINSLRRDVANTLDAVEDTDSFEYEYLTEAQQGLSDKYDELLAILKQKSSKIVT